MKAFIIPLTGKYYKTEIQVDFQDGYPPQVISLHHAGDSEPSVRELESLGYTQKDWDNNVRIPDGWGGSIPIREADLIDSSHFESTLTFERALKITELLNR